MPFSAVPVGDPVTPLPWWLPPLLLPPPACVFGVLVWVGPEAIFTGAAVAVEDDPEDPPLAAAGASEVDVVVGAVGSAVTVASLFGAVTRFDGFLDRRPDRFGDRFAHR